MNNEEMTKVIDTALRSFSWDQSTALPEYIAHIVSSAQATLQRAGVEAADLDLLVPHQANQRIIDAAVRRLGVPDEKVMSVLAHTGNTSAASIPFALAEAADQGRLADGDTVLLVGFGAGMTGASTLLRWGR